VVSSFHPEWYVKDLALSLSVTDFFKTKNPLVATAGPPPSTRPVAGTKRSADIMQYVSFSFPLDPTIITYTDTWTGPLRQFKEGLL
jgi:hypothetical protein